jgi:8-oxo-dGTP pyrophosphatase MutT (NUDIX family)
MPGLELIRAKIAGYEPSLLTRSVETQEAAVALILHQSPGAAPEILFIERTVREGDPWSGQMAFPGGRRSPEDTDLCTTAVRETLEEVDLDLGQPIGQLDDVHGGRADPRNRLVVAPFVFETRERREVRPNPEVRDAVWVPVPHLLKPGSAVEYPFDRGGIGGIFPAVRYERFTVWGLTYRILGHFLEVLGHQLPSP